MNKFIFLVLLIFVKKGIGQTFVLIPDVNFRTYLQNSIPSAMSGNSLNITSTLVTSGTITMSVSYNNIADLNGIQFFTSLASLFCQHNSLTSLPVLPSSLNFLQCSYNSLTNLPTLPNSLQQLACDNNSLASLPALPNTLTYLNCRNNPLTNLPALPNSILYILCENNTLTSLPSLPVSLLTLWCGDNLLTHLPPLPSSLENLACYNNFLTNLPLLGNSLHSLYCRSNTIVCFPTFPNSLTGVLIDPNPYYCLPNFVLPSMNNYTATPLCVPGTSNGCNTVGVKETNQKPSQLSIFPNPTTGQFTIETGSMDKQLLQLFDLNGELLFEQPIHNKTTILVPNLNAGVYNLTVKKAETSESKKLVIVN
jgi:hypothetical protein